MALVLYTLALIAIIILLTIGLIKPTLVLRWSKKPTRLKVLGLWAVFIFLAPVFSLLLVDEEEVSRKRIKSASEKIQLEEYSEAISELHKIKEGDTLFSEAQRLLKQADSLNQIKVEADSVRLAGQELENLKEQINRELNSLKKGIDFSIYRSTIQEMQIELALFATWASIIEKSESIGNDEARALGNQLREKVTAIQKREFPLLRKEYGRVVGQLMWEHDVYATTTGRSNTYLNLTGGIFAANKNIKDFQEQLQDALRMFRFKQIRYRWYKGADEYTYFDVYDGSDTDLVRLQ